jgi:hypothetical protein
MRFDQVGILSASARGDPELLHRDYLGVLSAVPGGVLTPLLDVPGVIGAALRALLVSIALVGRTVASAYPVTVRDAPRSCLRIDHARPRLVAALSSLTFAGRAVGVTATGRLRGDRVFAPRLVHAALCALSAVVIDAPGCATTPLPGLVAGAIIGDEVIKSKIFHA